VKEITINLKVHPIPIGIRPTGFLAGYCSIQTNVVWAMLNRWQTRVTSLFCFEVNLWKWLPINLNNFRGKLPSSDVICLRASMI